MIVAVSTIDATCRWRLAGCGVDDATASQWFVERDLDALRAVASRRSPRPQSELDDITSHLHVDPGGVVTVPEDDQLVGMLDLHLADRPFIPSERPIDQQASRRDDENNADGDGDTSMPTAPPNFDERVPLVHPGHSLLPR